MSGLVLLDRDGTINIDSGYVCKVEDVALIPGAAKAIGDLKRASFSVVIVTNQSAIGRGMATAPQVEACNEQLQKLLLEQDSDASIDQVLYSPAHPEEDSDCRKPKTGMLLKLKAELRNMVSSESVAKNVWMIGDKSSDIKFGVNAGLSKDKCLLVLTGEGQKTKARMGEDQKVFSDLLSASKAILAEN